MWRAAAEAGERAVVAAAEALADWALELERDDAPARLKTDALPRKARELRADLDAHVRRAAALREAVAGEEKRREQAALATAEAASQRRVGAGGGSPGLAGRIAVGSDAASTREISPGVPGRAPSAERASKPRPEQEKRASMGGMNPGGAAAGMTKEKSSTSTASSSTAGRRVPRASAPASSAPRASQGAARKGGWR